MWPVESSALSRIWVSFKKSEPNIPKRNLLSYVIAGLYKKVKCSVP